MTTTIDLNKILARVQKMLALADDPAATPAEADAARTRAEAYIREYRIAEEQLIASDQVEIRPEVHTLWLGTSHDSTRGGAGGRTGSQAGSSFYVEWYRMAELAARHAGIRVHYRWGYHPEDGKHGLFVVFVGYSGDVRLAEWVYTAARLVFSARIEPKPDPSLSDQLNCYRLRSAGIARPRISQMLWGTDKQAPKVSVLYKRECAERGETPVLDGKGTNAALYRDQFARSFVDELAACLRRARDAADSTGGALVLAGRAERIDEAFYAEFPELRPKPATEVAERETAPAKQGRRRKNYWETAAGRREMDRLHSTVGIAGSSAGRAAAREVELDRVKPGQRLGRGAQGALEG